MQKRDFETYQKRFRDFEILPKFSETHVFRGTIRHPCYWSVDKKKLESFVSESAVTGQSSFKAPCKRTQHCWMLHVASVCTPCCMLLDVVAQSLKPVKLFSQQLPTFLLFRDRRSVAQQCWIRLHSSSNIVGVTQAHYAWIYLQRLMGCIFSHDALQVPNLLPTRMQQLPTLLAQQCWELFRPFARSLGVPGLVSAL